MEGYRTQDDGWWRVISADGRVDWTDCDPRELLDGAWQDATVEGPFVPAADLRGAVEAHRSTCAAFARAAYDDGIDPDARERLLAVVRRHLGGRQA